MWECRKCSKPVFFAERKQSLGFDWHPNCLRCEECSKRLNPGQHAEHKGVPYCHHPCYGALFGPQLFGHGTRNECHTSFGKIINKDGLIKRSHLESHLKSYNQAYEGKPGELKWRKVNEKLVLEGVIRIYWGVRNLIHFKEEDFNRKSTRPLSDFWNANSFDSFSDSDDESCNMYKGDSPNALNKTPKVEQRAKTGELNGHNNNEKAADQNSNIASNSPSSFKDNSKLLGNGTSFGLTPIKFANTAIKRRSGRLMDKSKLKRRCSINGHFYLRETSSFTPPFGSACSLWVTSKTTTDEMLHLLLDKYKVEMPSSRFALFVVKDSGEQKRLKEEESPLITRVLLGANEDVAKIFIMDAYKTQDISAEVAQFLNLSMAELRAILRKYEEEEINCVTDVKKKCENMRLLLKKHLSNSQVQTRYKW